ncbi:hypothetical protein [Clostridium thailandense]|uniref:hypothetical protein n=1 Tax=Clostridium thailandense TaxID=2794346 RepID=UPI00398A4B4F
MDTSNNTSILSKFMAKEIEMIYMRYNEISREEINIISEFIEKLERNKVDLKPYLCYNTTKTLAEACKDIDDGELINFYVFVRCDISLDLDIEDVKDAYELNDKLYDSDYITAMY